MASVDVLLDPLVLAPTLPAVTVVGTAAVTLPTITRAVTLPAVGVVGTAAVTLGVLTLTPTLPVPTVRTSAPGVRTVAVGVDEARYQVPGAMATLRHQVTRPVSPRRVAMPARVVQV